MPEFFANFDLQSFLASYGYYAILLLTFLEGETIVILAGIAASRGILNPWLVVLSAFIGSCTSDQIMFSLGKYLGPNVLKYFPRLSNNMDRVGVLIKKYDIFLILGFRFVYGVRNVTPIMLGISHVPHMKFLVLNIIGALVWAASFTAGGFFLQKAFEEALNTFGSTVLYVIGFILLVAGSILYIRFRQNKKKAGELAAKGREVIQNSNSQAVPGLITTDSGLSAPMKDEAADVLARANGKAGAPITGQNGQAETKD